MGRLTTVRDALYNQILLKRTNTEYSENGFTASTAYISYQDLVIETADHPNGHVYVIALQHGDIPQASRQSKGMVQEHPVLVGFQKTDVASDITSEIDPLVDLCEELQDTARLLEVDGYSFTRIEMMRDDEGGPLNFVMLRDARKFESMFFAFYNYVLN